jgi:hypothetical protein
MALEAMQERSWDFKIRSYSQEIRDTLEQRGCSSTF